MLHVSLIYFRLENLNGQINKPELVYIKLKKQKNKTFELLLELILPYSIRFRGDDFIPFVFRVPVFRDMEVALQCSSNLTQIII